MSTNFKLAKAFDVPEQARINKWPMNSDGSIEWDNEILQNYLFQLITSFGVLPDPTDDESTEQYKYVIEKLFDQEALDKYWRPAFTDSSVNSEDNYEVFEYLGDRHLGSIFSSYCYKRFGKNYDQSVGTMLHVIYMDAKYQGYLSEQMGLNRFIKYHELTTNTGQKAKGNIFESFFGCLEELGNDRVSTLYGTGLCTNLITIIFDSIEINLGNIKKNPIMRLKEFFEKQNIAFSYKSDISDKPNAGNMKVTILNENGIPFTTQTHKIIGIGYGHDQTSAQEKASEELLQYFASIGRTEEMVAQEAQRRKAEKNPVLNREIQRLMYAVDVYNQTRGSQPGNLKIYKNPNDKNDFYHLTVKAFEAKGGNQQQKKSNVYGATLTLRFIASNGPNGIQTTDKTVVNNQQIANTPIDAQILALKVFNDSILGPNQGYQS